MLSALTRLFKFMFTSGFIPDDWLHGFIIPIKNKGDKVSPENYRVMLILSCFRKLFTAVLNYRLNIYFADMNILNKEQAGFRKNYSTIVHIFNLKCLIDYSALFVQWKKKYCAFTDCKKAFDSVNRVYLRQRPLNNSIDG